MSVHSSQAFSTYTSACDCTDSEHLPFWVHFRSRKNVNNINEGNYLDESVTI